VEDGRGSTMHVTQVQLKMIAIGLIPVFLVLTLIMPKTTTTTILLAIVIITAIVISIIGWCMQKRETAEDEDLLAVPPKKS
jgi:mannose/fructose/N-acetylgalactosamine-specific phosphotransferase system component IID